MNDDYINIYSKNVQQKKHDSEVDELKEEIELLNIKAGRLRYDLKSRDATVDDLKLKISQMFVDLELTQFARKQTQLDIELLKSENTRINNEKANLYEQLKCSNQDADKKQQQLQILQLNYAEQELFIEKLKRENDSLSKQLNLSNQIECNRLAIKSNK